MPKKAKSEVPFKPNIIHIMADGSVRDSIEGYEVPVNQYTEICYEMLAKQHQLRTEPSA